MSFKKKFVASLLLFSVLAGNFSSFSLNKNENFVKAEENLGEISPKNYLNNYSDEDLVKVIVKLKEEKIDPSILNDDIKIKLREDKTKIAREEALKVFKSEGINYKKLTEYSLLFNGFALELKFSDYNKLKTLDIVEDVNLNVEYSKPTFNTKVSTQKKSGVSFRSASFSEDVININPLREKNIKGQGMVVAVIDSGLDLDHNMLRISDLSKAKYKNSDEIEALKKKVGINYGTWFSDKVVFGYNYNDLNNELEEKSPSSHGTHVSGIAVGNPNEPSPSGEIITGVAPEAQLIFMRVFSDKNSPGSTSAFIYAKAIEDSVKLGADSINMSIGSPTGTVNEMGKILVNALELAKSAGVTVSIAGGNDGAFGDGFSKPSAKNPDYGLVADPSVLYESLSVAAIENNFIRSQVMTVNALSGNEKFNSGKIQISEPSIPFIPTKDYSFVFVGKGKPEDFSGKDLTGKLALIERGDIPFTEKVKNAKTANAIGVVIFNNKDGGNQVISMSLGDESKKIPVTSIGNEIGLELSANENYTLKFDGSISRIQNPNANMLTNFSSWGLSNDGELKPDITAPGGGIYSSVNDGKYESQNGTSMASPHVAGALSLLKQAYKDKYPNLKGEKLHLLAKQILMSTATPNYNTKKKAYTSPRQQGAGVINVDKAVNSSLYVTGKNGYSSLSLGNVNEIFNFDIVVHNLSNETKTLKYVTNLGTDEVVDGHFTLLPRELSVTDGKTFVVPANGSKTLNITIDSSKFTENLTSLMPNGYFLEGFVRILNSVDGVEEVSIPFVGFKGEFENLPVIEKPIYDFEGEEKPFYYEESEINYTTFLTEEDNAVSGRKGELILGEYIDLKDPTKVVLRKDKLAFSPGIKDKNKDLIAFKATFLRNFKNFNVSIYRADDVERKNPVYNKGNVFGTKSYFGGKGRTLKAVILPETLWEGTDNSGNQLPEGNYKYVITVRPDVPGAKDQVYEYDIILDNTLPHFTGGKYDAETRTFKPHKAFDAHSGIYKTTVTAGSTEIFPNEEGNYVIPESIDPSRVNVMLEDFAGNIDDAFKLMDTNTLGEAGVIDFKLMVDNLTEDYSKSLARFKITDEQGNIVAYETFQKATGFDPLTFDIYWKTLKKFPFGKYKVEIVLHHPDLDIISPKIVDVELNSENPYAEVIFKARELFSNKATIVFDDIVDDSVKVFAINDKGEKIELTHSKFDRRVFEKELINGEYKIVIEAPRNYHLSENNFKLIVDKGRNQKEVSVEIFNREIFEEIPVVNLETKTETKVETKPEVKTETKVENKVLIADSNSTWEKQTDGSWKFKVSEEHIENAWVKDGKNWFRLEEDGKLSENKLIEVNGSKFYAKNGGYIAENEWVFTNNKWHYANSGGYLAENQWVNSKGDWYWIGNDNTMVENKWEFYKGNWYYLGSSGKMLKSGWNKINGKWYHFKDNGELSVSTKVGKYRVDENGEWIKN